MSPSIRQREGLRIALVIMGLGLLVSMKAAPAFAGVFDPLRPWTLVAIPGELADASFATHLLSAIEGDVCVAGINVGSQSRFSGVVVSRAGAGSRVRVRSIAQLEGDVLTDGAAVVAVPRGSALPGLIVPMVPSGRVVARRDALGNYDTTGDDERLLACGAAQASTPAVTEALEAFPPVLEFGGLRAGASETLRLTRPVDVETVVVETRRLFLGQNARLILDADGSTSAVFILRIDGRVRSRLGAEIILDGGLDASRVLVYGRDDCEIGERNAGFGTLYCPTGKVALRPGTVWEGAVVGSGNRIDLGAGSTLIPRPFAGL